MTDLFWRDPRAPDLQSDLEHSASYSIAGPAFAKGTRVIVRNVLTYLASRAYPSALGTRSARLRTRWFWPTLAPGLVLLLSLSLPTWASPELPCGPVSPLRLLSPELLPSYSLHSIHEFARDFEKSTQLLPYALRPHSTESDSESLPLGITIEAIQADRLENSNSRLYIGEITSLSPSGKIAGWKHGELMGGQLHAREIMIGGDINKSLRPTEADRVSNARYGLYNHNSITLAHLPERNRQQLGLRIGVDTDLTLDLGSPSGSAIPHSSIEWKKQLGKRQGPELRIQIQAGVQTPRVTRNGIEGTDLAPWVGARASVLQF